MYYLISLFQMTENKHFLCSCIVMLSWVNFVPSVDFLCPLDLAFGFTVKIVATTEVENAPL